MRSIVSIAVAFFGRCLEAAELASPANNAGRKRSPLSKGELEGDFLQPRPLLLILLALTLLSQPASAESISWTVASRGAGADERYVGEPISMSLRDADLVETLRTFSRIGGFNLIIQPGVKGTVTVELKGVPWDQALDAILRMNGLGMDLTQGTLRVADSETLEREAENGEYYGTSPLLETRSIEGTLTHVDAGRVATLLRTGSYLSKYGSAAVRAGNVLLLEERLGRARRLARFVQQLDDAEVAGLEGEAFERRAEQLWLASRPR